MSVFGSKNMGLSDSLIDAVKEVGQSGKTIQTNLDIWKNGLQEKKMDPVGKEDDDVDNDGDSDSSDKYLKKRRQAITKAVKGGKKEKDMGQDQVDVNPQMDDMKEAKVKENYLGHNDAAKLNGGKSRDSNFNSPESHIDYHHRQSGGHLKSGGDQDRHRYQVAKKLGYHVEAAGSRPQDKQDGETKLIKPSDSHLCATKVEHAEWGVGECIFSEHAEPDDNGHVAWYDVLFDHGIEKQVSISEMKVIEEMNHGNHKKKK